MKMTNIQVEQYSRVVNYQGKEVRIPDSTDGIYGLGHPFNGMSDEEVAQWILTGLSVEEIGKHISAQQKNNRDSRASTVAEMRETGKKLARKTKREKQEVRDIPNFDFSVDKIDSEKAEDISVTTLDVFDKGYSWLKQLHGDKLSLIHDITNDMHGGIVFSLESAIKPTPGIQIPSGFRFWKVAQSFQSNISSRLATIPNKAIRQEWLSLYNGNPSNCLISKTAKWIDWLPKSKSVSIDGNRAFKVIPKLDWFSPEIQAIDPYDLLAIFPRPEADMLMLHIGRIALGAGKMQGNRENTLVEAEVEYGYRYVALLNGEPLLGKSTLMTFIETALEPLGYSFAGASGAFNQFTWLKLGAMDGINNDETTVEHIVKMFKDPTFKAIAAGMRYTSEAKGGQIQTLPSGAAITMCGNFTELPQIEDSGIMSRLLVINCRSTAEIDALSSQRGQNMRTRDYFNDTARKLGVDVRDLTLYLVRRSLDKFAKEVGLVKLEDGTWVQDKQENKLDATVADIRKNFRFQYRQPVTAQLPAAARKSFILTKFIADATGQPLDVPDEFDESFNAFTLVHLSRTMNGFRELHKNLETMKKALEEKGEIKKVGAVERLQTCFGEVRDYMHLNTFAGHTWTQLIKQWEGNIAPLSQPFVLGTKSRSFEELWNFTTKLVTTKEGLPIVSERQKYGDHFTINKRNAVAYESQIKCIFSKHGITFDNPVVKKLAVQYLAIPYYFCE